MTAPHLRALAETEPAVFWLDSADAPRPRPALVGAHDADLVVVGGGFTGLWAALMAREDDPAREVVLVEGETVAFGASGRNGGFVEASLTHGLSNGLQHFPDEIGTLLRLGRENFAAIGATVERLAIDARLERVGVLVVATEAHQVDELAEEAALLRAHGSDVELLDAEATRALVDSPTYRASLVERGGQALVDPARLAFGLRSAAIAAGVRIYERTRATRLRDAGTAVVVECELGSVRAAAVVLATAAFDPLVRAIRRYVVPVYDYALVTEPLSAAQRDAVGWKGRHGVADAGNQFHYYRLTADDRILWGGYDAVYHFGNDIGPHRDHRARTYELLARQFLQTFPQLEGIRFTHRWGGAIDTCTRFCALWGTAHHGRVAYAVGYTGLGVAASRFGARVAIDLVDGLDTERTRLRMVRRRPVPFPPEPLRWAGIEITRRSLAAADRNGGRRNLWLRALDRAGMGFDS
jgi:glycine/D-amino acid oxidase-like deaminating enzyme